MASPPTPYPAAAKPRPAPCASAMIRLSTIGPCDRRIRRRTSWHLAWPPHRNVGPLGIWLGPLIATRILSSYARRGPANARRDDVARESTSCCPRWETPVPSTGSHLGRPGIGATCTVCGLPITKQENEFEIEFPHNGSSPGARQVPRAHPMVRRVGVRAKVRGRRRGRRDTHGAHQRGRQGGTARYLLPPVLGECAHGPRESGPRFRSARSRSGWPPESRGGFVISVDVTTCGDCQGAGIDTKRVAAVGRHCSSREFHSFRHLVSDREIAWCVSGRCQGPIQRYAAIAAPSTPPRITRSPDPLAPAATAGS